ncbi:MAG: hypothetical protein AAF289_07520 [Cyanobacteria bacterium P01_A01_bin.135]
MKTSICAIGVLSVALAVVQPAAADTLNEFQRQVEGQLNDAQAVLEQKGYTLVERYIDQQGLGETESRDRPLQLDPRSDYVITAVCDSDCDDLDLVLYAAGSEVARDTASDAYPVLALQPQAQTHELEVTMYGCGAEPCYFGFSVFRQAAR